MVAKEGAEGELNAKLFPNKANLRGQTVKSLASPSNEQRKPWKNSSLENGPNRAAFALPRSAKKRNGKQK